jgi:hypothetical protein
MMESGEAQKILEARKAKTDQRKASAVQQAGKDPDFAATLAELAKTVSALAAKSVTISSVTSKTDDDTSLSVITAATPTSRHAPVTALEHAKEPAPPAANDKKKHPPGELTKARLESAGGQFGRNGIGNLKKTSFPDTAVKQAKGIAISSVMTIDTKLSELDLYAATAPTPLSPPVALFHKTKPAGGGPVKTPAKWLKPSPTLGTPTQFLDALAKAKALLAMKMEGEEDAKKKDTSPRCKMQLFK